MRDGFLTALLLVLLAGSPALAEEGGLTEVVPVSSQGTLHVELDRGTVNVVSHDEPEVRIEARARGVGASSVHFALRSEGGDLVLTGRLEQWLSYMQTGPSVSVRAWVPREYDVEVHTLVQPVSAARNAGL